jgi:D-serine dehydratase
MVGGKSVAQWRESHPLLRQIMDLQEVCRLNPRVRPVEEVLPTLDIGENDVADAAARFRRFAPYIASVFPETVEAGGLIESPLRKIETFREFLERNGRGSTGARKTGSSGAAGADGAAGAAATVVAGRDFSVAPGKLWLKCDNELPISGSIKARGGIHEVLAFAERCAAAEGMLPGVEKAGGPGQADDYGRFADPDYRELFSRYSLAVGSTGNLGLSIGIMGARLGFSVTVHMSADARQWKKDLLRSHGVTVVEYPDDYSTAVAEGRRLAAEDRRCHFVDDENSRMLFMGYAVAGERLARQCREAGIWIDAEHPLYVYLPCGVGGGPGGVAFGLKLAFGNNVRCFFAEPTHSPAMLVGLYTGLHEKVSVGDFGVDNRTAADGLAVGRPSGFVGRRMEYLIDGAFTVSDERMFRLLAGLYEAEGIALEPSALAGFPGPEMVAAAESRREGAGEAERDAGAGGAIAGPGAAGATHIVWATGGGMVPAAQMEEYLKTGRALLDDDRS